MVAYLKTCLQFRHSRGDTEENQKQYYSEQPTKITTDNVHEREALSHTSLLRQYKRNLKCLSSIHSGYNYNKYRHSLLVVGLLDTSH
jgi:hypothetical protein